MERTVAGAKEILVGILKEGSFLREIKKKVGYKENQSLYQLSLVIFLMVIQRLDQACAMSKVISCLALYLEELGMKKRANISSNTGGYAAARQRIPASVVELIRSEGTEKIRQLLPPEGVWEGRRVYLLDGSMITLAHEEELVKAYPPARNQHGSSHWPIFRVVVAHELGSGLALEPAWGPITGANSVSEQQLAFRVIEKLPRESVILADRNFGVLSIVYAATQKGHGVLVRLSAPRAKKLWGKMPPPGLDRPIDWIPSPHEIRSVPGLKPGVGVRGRLICQNVVREGQVILLYLFTTLGIPTSEVVELYGERWHIEGDLRSLKRSLCLHEITAKSVAMVEKELQVGILTYNLVRVVMVQAAAQSGVPIRQLSFTRVLYLLQAATLLLATAKTDAQREAIMRDLIRRAATARLPRKTKNRREPRKVWPRQRTYPMFRGSREDARRKLAEI